MFEFILKISLIGISISILGLIYRVIKGPSVPDRVVALDAIGINLISMVAIVSILLNTHAFFEVILLIGILSFIGTVAFSKYLQKGVILERERDL
ncbi:Na(+)/H(+) antiporter subunit F1 [Bacillus aquiflavi]|uniref:Na(+)/H(+) antiporter subunit F1 n=1 Tax=Bacillus aquiflavi TaxID=2672567 RepID=A0A6B3VVT7_9BACI|nr:Na(+)/H(+) antiporter subunit F1 [Bacillus aquiflavi]MBA4536031.1 Na(+)/H(+) antiporter subunit F1 [Bacillus aquiflavi]NEY80405.1 Na(+)/H(+) antiporter subunit F1 [Bacillus aquiflavi]UAC47684.1 Na(+)/H(+) antiporter subunit F1 [Bacillus aquiflavi]